MATASATVTSCGNVFQYAVSICWSRTACYRSHCRVLSLPPPPQLGLRLCTCVGWYCWCSHSSSTESVTVAHAQVRSRQGKRRGNATLYETARTAWERPSVAYSCLASGWLVQRCWRIPVKTPCAFHYSPLHQWDTVCTWRIVAALHTKPLQHQLYRSHGWHWIHPIARSGKGVGRQDTHSTEVSLLFENVLIAFVIFSRWIFASNWIHQPVQIYTSIAAGIHSKLLNYRLCRDNLQLSYPYVCKYASWLTLFLFRATNTFRILRWIGFSNPFQFLRGIGFSNPFRFLR